MEGVGSGGKERGVIKVLRFEHVIGLWRSAHGERTPYNVKLCPTFMISINYQTRKILTCLISTSRGVNVVRWSMSMVCQGYGIVVLRLLRYDCVIFCHELFSVTSM